MKLTEHAVSTEEMINGCKISVGKRNFLVQLGNCAGWRQYWTVSWETGCEVLA